MIEKKQFVGYERLYRQWNYRFFRFSFLFYFCFCFICFFIIIYVFQYIAAALKKLKTQRLFIHFTVSNFSALVSCIFYAFFITKRKFLIQRKIAFLIENQILPFSDSDSICQSKKRSNNLQIKNSAMYLRVRDKKSRAICCRCEKHVC